MKKASWVQYNEDLIINDVPSFQDKLFKDITDTNWRCIQKGVELYLGYPMDAEDASLVTINIWPDGRQSIYYNGAHIGNVISNWVTNEHIMRYQHTFTLEP